MAVPTWIRSEPRNRTDGVSSRSSCHTDRTSTTRMLSFHVFLVVTPSTVSPAVSRGVKVLSLDLCTGWPSSDYVIEKLRLDFTTETTRSST